MAAFSVASRLSNASDILLCDMAEKAPAVDGPGQVGRAERNVEFSPSRSATSVGRLRAEHPLVALPTFWVLFIQKFARRSQGTKTFDLNQNFEPVRATGDPRSMWAAVKMHIKAPLQRSPRSVADMQHCHPNVYERSLFCKLCLNRGIEWAEATTHV